MSQPTAIDAFCGAGGLSLGLHQAGFNVLLGFDNDPVSIRTQLENPRYIDHPVWVADARSIDGEEVLNMIGLERGQLGLLAGGPPCQGFSMQRTIGKESDHRNLLVHDYGDLIRALLPRMFLMENVPGIGGKRGREVLLKFKHEMENAGYSIQETTLDAQNFGVPQRRRRVLVVGERLDGGGPQFKWPEESLSSPPTVRDIIAGLPIPPPDGTDHPSHHGHRADRLSELNKERLRAIGPGQGRTDLPKELLAECHMLSADTIGHRNVYGRMSWDSVAPTITARFDSFTRGQFGHPEQVRTISLYEGALLQTFPKDYHFTGTKVEIARQIGNAIPIKFATALGESILTVLKETP
ncbi:MAG: DNA cytosine methyltransferase [Verrucomicrobia bacterium]|nr:DNA cytosine methyltransferase [Verrucomicrobiota bacterium]